MTAAPLRRAAARALRAPMVNRAVRALARARGHRLVLVYHRVGEPPSADCEVVPSVPLHVFRAHLQALGDTVDLVSLDEILAREDVPPATSGGRRPAVAVTFDDDLSSHAAVALPVLRDRRVRAAFFLSGRALHGRGAYWFQQLETLLAIHGRAHVAALVGVPGAAAAGLALACERDAARRLRVASAAQDLPVPGLLDRGGLAALSAAGMTIGFHTVDHASLPAMLDGALDDAVTRGRESLAAATGAPVRYFAYPHGRADARSAGAVRRAGFDAAFTGRPEPLRPGSDRHRLGRWEPGPLGVDELLVKLAVRLHRASPS